MSETFVAGPLRVRAVGGSDRRGGGDGPSVLLCHGYGAPGDDLVPFARVVDAGPNVRWFFPEAPIEFDAGYGGGTARAWWPIDMMRIQALIASGRPRQYPVDETPEGSSEAADALTACIDALVAQQGVDRSSLVIGGFSQGAMITTDLSTRTPTRGLIILSGALLSAPRWRASLTTTGSKCHVFQSHGRGDPLLPYAVAEQLRTTFEEAGAKVSFHAHGGQHEIPPGVVQALGPWIRARHADKT